MQELKLPTYEFKITSAGRGKQIFDPVRRKYVSLTPEEWVRQHVIRFLSEEKKYPLSLIQVEAPLKYNSLSKRGDLVIYKNSVPAVIVECKAPSVKINQETFYQIAAYNFVLKVPYLFVTNGLDHYSCKVDLENNSVTFLKDLPEYNLL